MLFNPSILALMGVSFVVTLMLLLAAGFAVQVLRHWDINSGSERQLNLERRTYLISTLVVFAFVAELVSLLLFIYNAEQLSSQFVGAMCATGVLNINEWGWPALYFKIGVFFAGAAWLTLNRVDNKAPDYPLVRVKYALLLLLVPLVIAETWLQANHFLAMDADVITSCCGSLFSPEGQGVAATMSAVSPDTALFLLIAGAVVTLLSGSWFLWRSSGGLLFATSSGVSFLLALVAIVSCIALYIYEHPQHHCPFCILKGGHDFMGYALYIPLFIATALSLGAGMLAPFKRRPSLHQIIADDSRYLVGLSLIFLLLFYAVAGYAIVGSNLTMMDVWWQK